MGYVKQEIQKLITSTGSKKLASKQAEIWFTNALTNMQKKEVVNTRTRFVPGKIYVFKYQPITEKLAWFDQNPVVLAIERNEDNDLGINLNLLPIKVKERLLDDLYVRLNKQIINASKKENATQQAPLKITYIGMQTYLKRFGYDFAIRQYKPMQKIKQAVVTYESWPKIALCDFISLNGTTLQEIRLQFRKR